MPEEVDLERVLAAVEEPPHPLEGKTARPVLVMMSGLPGTGKSYIARRLIAKHSLGLVESDRVRKHLFAAPTYSAQESLIVHRTCHALLAHFLQQGLSVIYDATNLAEFHRELVYRIVDRKGAKLVIIKTVAPQEVVEKRLAHNSGRGNSDATWEVYLSLAKSEESIRRPHLVVDTTGNIEEALGKILRAIKRR